MLSLFPQIVFHFYLRNTALPSEQFMNHSRYFSETKSLCSKPNQATAGSPSCPFPCCSFPHGYFGKKTLVFRKECADLEACTHFFREKQQLISKTQHDGPIFCFYSGTFPPGGCQAGAEARLGRLVKADAPGREQRANSSCHIHPEHTCSTSCFISRNFFFWAF